MGKWKKNSQQMVEFMQKQLGRFDARPTQMFGCPVWFVNGNMFAGLHEDNVMVRLSPDDIAAVMEESDEVVHFEPVKGRKMREYVVLPESIYGDGKELGKWLDRSYEFTSSLPPKMSGKKERKGK